MLALILAAAAWWFPRPAAEEPPVQPQTGSATGLPIAVNLETDPSKINKPRPGSWAVPNDVPLPVFQGFAGCSRLDAWAVKQPMAVESDKVFRITVTGRADEAVVIHGVTPKIVSQSPMPKNWRMLTCPIGDQLNEVNATVDLEHPTGTTYADATGRSMEHLDYSLAKGEAAVFYVQLFGGTDQVTMWDILLDISVGATSSTLDLNEIALQGKHFESSTSCGIPTLEYSGSWTQVSDGTGCASS